MRLTKRVLQCATAASRLPFVPSHTPTSAEDANALAQFIANHSRIFVLTGAGISTESGIPDYRGQGVGLYSTGRSKPIEYQTFLRSFSARRRYWARNYLGWPRFSAFEANRTHRFLAHLERRGRIHWLVTQNVDRLHQKAGSERVTDLHGTAFTVSCVACKRFRTTRHRLQQSLTTLNEGFHEENLGELRPDGDVTLSDEQVGSFRPPICPQCHDGGIIKPEIVFFGENVARERVEAIQRTVKSADAALVLGSSLSVFSGYRFIIRCHELGLPIFIVNIGPTRADHMAMRKVEARLGDIAQLIAHRF